MVRARDADKEARALERASLKALAEKRKEKRAAAARRMRERQAKIEEKRLSAEKLAEAEALLEKEDAEGEEGEEGEVAGGEDDEYASGGESERGQAFYYGAAAVGRRRHSRETQGFNVVVMHDDDAEGDDGVSTDRGLSQPAQDFLQSAMNRGQRGPTHVKRAGFVSGKLTKARSYRRKRPTKRQKREWAAAAAERRVHGGGENDSDFDEEREAEELASIGITFE
eukprot:g2239.t1